MNIFFFATYSNQEEFLLTLKTIFFPLISSSVKPFKSVINLLIEKGALLTSILPDSIFAKSSEELYANSVFLIKNNFKLFFARFLSETRLH